MNRRHLISVILLLALSTGLHGCSSARSEATDLCNLALRYHWGEWNDVIEITTEAISIDPEFSWPYSQRGAAYNELGMYNEAITDLQKAIKLEPGFGAAYTNLAISYLRSGQHENAKKYLERAYELTPNDPVMLESMAEYLALEENMTSACEWLGRALENGYDDWNHLEITEYLNDFRNAPCYSLLLQDTAKPPLIFESH